MSSLIALCTFIPMKLAEMKKISVSSLILCLIIFDLSIGIAQYTCGNELIAQVQEQHLRKLNISPYGKLSNEQIVSRSSTIYIPVVVHILYRTENQNLNESVIRNQMDILNRAFSKRQSDNPVKLGDDLYTPGKADIRFCLATETPDGLPTNGIVRKRVTMEKIGTSFMDQSRIAAHYEIFGGSDAWDINRYMNIWICETGDIIGKSTIPGEPYHEEEEGVIINIDYLNNYPQRNLGLVIVHETGHYLGLYHLWGKKEGCEYDDYVDDTPLQEKPLYDCVYSESCGSPDMFFNYMNYTPESCWKIFTEGQVARMRSIIADYYPTFISNSSACSDSDMLSLPDIQVEISSHYINLRPGDSNQFLSGEIHLYDVRGKEIYHAQVQDAHSALIPTYLINPGIYFIRFSPENSKAYFSKKLFIH